jgi:hypothetical protein
VINSNTLTATSTQALPMHSLTLKDRSENKKITKISKDELDHRKEHLYRPIIELAKVVNGACYGTIHGVLTAKDIICDVGAPVGAFGALTAIVLRSGQENSPGATIFKHLFQNPLVNLFQGNSSQEGVKSSLEFTNRYFINGTPQEYFFSGLLQGSLFHTAMSSHPEAATKGKLAAEEIEDLAFKNGFIKEKEKHSTFYAEKAARISSKISSIASITLLSEIIRYGFDANSYQNLTFSEHMNKEIYSPIQDAYNYTRTFFFNS